MYALPNVVPTKSTTTSNTATRFAPILAVCLLLSIAFVIAVVIVLSLIPLYIPRKSASLAQAAQDFLLSLDLPQSIGDDGEVDATARETIARQLETAFGIPVGSLTVTQGIVASEDSKRRKRDGGGNFPLRRAKRARKYKLHCRYRFNLQVCTSCARTSFIASIPPVQIVLQFIYNGIQVAVQVVADLKTSTSQFTVPSTLAPSTTTASTTATTPSTTTSTTTPEPAGFSVVTVNVNG